MVNRHGGAVVLWSGLALLIGLVMLTQPSAGQAPAFRVLVFSRTTAFRHTASIAAGLQAIKDLGAGNNFAVDTTEDATTFTAANLARYRVVVFLSTTSYEDRSKGPALLNTTQRAAFEQYIRAGGGYVGIHAASDAEYDWPWYGGLVGAWFKSHPAVQNATIKVEDRTHVSTAHLGTTWNRRDEWYNFRTNPRGNVNVLLTLDETSYDPESGAMGADHPIAWYHTYDGGRAWYTGGGHTPESFSETAFRQHILGGIVWAANAGAQPTPAPSTGPTATPPALTFRTYLPLASR